MSGKGFNFEWPDGREVLFGEGGSRALTVNGRRPHSIDTFASAYRRAAQTLFEAIRTRSRAIDLDLFPLAFLWRQYLELSLKSLIMKDRDIRGEPVEYPTHHKLIELWDAVEPSLRANWPTAPEQEYARRVIDQFDRVDPGSFDFRYPEARSGQATRENLAEWVDLAQFDDTMRKIANVLDASVSAAMHALAVRDGW